MDGRCLNVNYLLALCRGLVSNTERNETAERDVTKYRVVVGRKLYDFVVLLYFGAEPQLNL